MPLKAFNKTDEGLGKVLMSARDDRDLAENGPSMDSQIEAEDSGYVEAELFVRALRAKYRDRSRDSKAFSDPDELEAYLESLIA